MALVAYLMGCLLPLLDPPTPINTRASGTLQRTKKHRGKIGKKTLERRCPYNPSKVVRIFQAKAVLQIEGAHAQKPSD